MKNKHTDLNYLEKLIKENPGKFTDIDGDELSPRDLRAFIGTKRNVIEKINKSQNNEEVVLLLENFTKTNNFIPAEKYDKYKNKIFTFEHDVEYLSPNDPLAIKVQKEIEIEKTNAFKDSLTNYGIVIVFISILLLLGRKFIVKTKNQEVDNE